MSECARFVIQGRVQGVGFRASTRQQAQDLGLTGWVRNRPDGAVEALACGEPEPLARFHEWLWQGPGAARVSQVERHLDTQTANPPAGFQIL